MNFEAVTRGTGQLVETYFWPKLIKNQIKKNYLCNIFNKKVSLNIQNIEKQNIEGITEDQISILSKYSANLLSSHLYNGNQYIYFNNKALKELEEIYQYFYTELLKKQNRHETIKNHHDKIKNFLVLTNPFLKKINSNDEKKVMTFLCREYSGSFQLKLFNVKMEDIIGPVLDIGCGEHAHLTSFLNNRGITAIGIDRKTVRRRYTVECDWFDFNFEENKYGIVFSNNAFSIHFINAFYKNQNIPIYTRLFFRILNSLKEGGCFCYAPSIPFIEKYVNAEEYSVSYLNVQDNLYMTKILRNMRMN